MNRAVQSHSMPAKTSESLEFGEIRRILMEFASSPLGRRAAEQLAPFEDEISIRLELQAVQQCLSWMERGAGCPPLNLDADPGPVLQRVVVAGVVLDAEGILTLADLARSGMAVKTSLHSVASEYPRLAEKFQKLKNFSPFLADIEKKFQPDGLLSDHASPTLRQIRRRLESHRNRIQEMLRQYLQKHEGDILQDQFITERNGRFVLPVRANVARRFEGVVHGTSSSGATLFIEPLKTVDLNNQLFQLQEKEREETQRILGEISQEIHRNLQDWSALVESVTYLDLLRAKVRFLREYEASIPQLSDSGELLLNDARHPLLMKQCRETGQEVVPISLRMGPDRRVLILSGPNAGGKTVALKSVGLISLMAICGLPVTARDAVLPVFHRILVDIGDQQSIQSNLSTFSAHLLALHDIIENTRGASLVLLDEVGTGTDPEQGAALAIAIIEELKNRGAMVVATTHYNRLKAFGYQKEGVGNMAVEFDTVALKPTYRLIDGVAGGSSGLEMASRLGMTPSIVEAARRLVDPRDLETDRGFEAIREKLSALDEARRQSGLERQLAEQERAELQIEYGKRRAQLEKQLQDRFDEQTKSFKAAADKILRSVQRDVERARRRRQVERRFDHLKAKARESLLTQQQGGGGTRDREPVGALHAGERVRVLSLDLEGVVERVENSSLDVSVLGKRCRIDRKDIQLLRGSIESSSPSRERTIADGIILEISQAEELPQELVLVGCTTDEALERTDKFLDRAALANRQAVRLVHGYGKGKLRNALAEFLVDHPHVAASHPAALDEGGKAVTVVELRTG